MLADTTDGSRTYTRTTYAIQRHGEVMGGRGGRGREGSKMTSEQEVCRNMRLKKVPERGGEVESEEICNMSTVVRTSDNPLLNLIPDLPLPHPLTSTVPPLSVFPKITLTPGAAAGCH